MLSVGAFADSYYQDSARLDSCGGRVELRQAGNGDLALKFVGVNQRYCTNLRFVDVSNRKTIKSYPFEGTSYTLNKKMEKELGKDCAVEYQLSNYNGRVVDSGRVVLKWWACYRSPVVVAPVPLPAPKVSPYSYAISGNGNCKVMKYGSYTNVNTSKDFCAPISGYAKGTSVSYAWSQNDNCKIMINGRYSNENTPKSMAYRYCNATH